MGLAEHCFAYKLPGTPIPQGRVRVPRFGKPYYSKRSKAYREELVSAIRSRPLPLCPLGKAHVFIYAKGMRSNADPDNLAKQVLDALVDAKVLGADTCSVVELLQVQCLPEKKAKERYLLINVLTGPLEVPCALQQP